MSVTQLQYLPFHRASIDENDIESVVRVLRSGWLTTGAEAQRFESTFAGYVGAKEAVALSSCTAALHLGLAAIKLREGDEVILPTMTFSSTGEVVLYFKAVPVLVDCEADSFQMDPAAIERAITPRTRAIIVVHFAGSPANLDAILDIARRHRLTVIEDAAHALPARYKGKMIGSFGDICCFSFYATKTITTGEGGMLTTEDPEVVARVRMLSLHGISKDAYKRYTAEGSWRYDIEAIGFKYNLTDLQAAIGLVQLSKCRSTQASRAALAQRYTKELSSADAFITPPVTPENVEHALHLYVLQVREGVLNIGRDRVIEELKARGIGTSVHFIPLHLHSLYQQHCGYHAGDFPNAEKRFAGSISLPLFPGMSLDEQDRVIEALREIAELHRR